MEGSDGSEEINKFVNNDNSYQVHGYRNIAPMNSSILNDDDRKLSTMFESLEISTLDNSCATNGHRRVSSSRNAPVANDITLNSVNYSSVDWSIRQDLLLQLDNGSLMRMRSQSAALGQIGYPAPHQNYPSSGHYNDFNLLLGKSKYVANTYNPHAYHNQLNSNLHDQNSFSNYNWYPPNSLAYMHNGYGSRPSYYSFLQKRLEEGNCEGVAVIFSAVKNFVRELMVDHTGSSLIQRVFEKCNDEQIDQLLHLVLSDQRILVAICVDRHGTRSMQKLLENLTTIEQRFPVLSALGHLTINLSKSLFGRQVIQYCLIHFPSEETMVNKIDDTLLFNVQIQRVIADGCLQFAIDKNGCCVVQVCAEYTHGRYRDKILAQVAESAVYLSEHPYGNYVVSKLVSLKKPYVTEAILAKLAGNYVSLAMNKHGSNVVENCLRQTEFNQSLQIIWEIIGSPCFLMVLQDRYGNYVAQSAVDISKGRDVYVTLTSLINSHSQSLQSHLYGKRVLGRITGKKKA